MASIFLLRSGIASAIFDEIFDFYGIKTRGFSCIVEILNLLLNILCDCIFGC